MSIRKRALSLFVTFAMCFSILPSSVWAVETVDRQEESAPVGADVVEALPLAVDEVTSAEAAVEDAPALPEDDAPAQVADVPMEEGAGEPFPDSAVPPEDVGVLPEEEAAVEEPFPEDAGEFPMGAAVSTPREETSLDNAITPEDEQDAGTVNADEEEALPEKEGGPETEEEEEVDVDKSLTVEEAGSYAPEDEEKDIKLLEEQAREVMESSSAYGQVIWSDSTYLDPGWSVAYSYRPTVSGTYTFESTNVSGDTYGWLTSGSSNGTQLISNDDGGRANGNYLNFSFSYTLTAGTIYYFHARWLSSSRSGTITCQLSRSTSVQSITADGVSHTVTLTSPRQYAYFSFRPSVSGTYVFESTNSSGDTYGYLYDSSWRTLTYNDDGGSGLNFRISYALTSGNTYYFGVRFYGSYTTGSITVRLTGNIPQDKVLSQPTASSYVTDYQDITTRGERKYFRFTPSTTGYYIFESTNSSYDPVGELYQSNKTTQITSNDDGGNGANFRIRYNLTAGTTYYYAVRFFGGSTIARINVRLTLEYNIVPIVLNASEVALKGYSTSSVNPSSTSNSAVSNGNGYFSFTPTVSGTYLFESTNSSGDPRAYLYYSIGGSQVSSNDDSGDANGNHQNFRLSYSLSANTTYIYTVGWNGSTTGDINVRIRRSLSELATTMEPGYTGTATISQRGQAVYFAFTPPSTQDYSFESSNNVSADSSVFDPYVTLYDANFNYINSNDDGGEGRNFYLNARLTQDITYYYAVTRWSNSSTGSATVRLSGGIPDATEIDAAAVENDGQWTGTANISRAGEYAYFVFTPLTSGAYIFESTNTSGDTHGHFYENGLGTTSTVENDDSGQGLNFQIARNLEAGRTYAYAARWHWSGGTGPINVRLVKDTPPLIPLDADAVEQNNYTTETTTIATGGRRSYFSFTPQSDGDYIFESTNTSGDTYGYFYETSEPPTDTTSSTVENDDGGSGLNFKLTRTLNAGTTYYYGVRFLSRSATGTINVKLSKGNPPVLATGVTVTLNPASIYVGNQATASAQITPDNTTNKTLTWSSSDVNVATVTGGIVTAVAVGTATITATTSNGIAGSATITVIESVHSGEFHEDYEYPFLNTRSSFGYSSSYKVPQVRFEQVGYTPQQAASIYNAGNYETRNAYWGGSCFGIAASAILFYKNVLQEENYDPNVHIPHDFHAPSGNSSNDVKLRSMIELMQLSQPFWNRVDETPRQDFNPQQLAAELDNDNPVVLQISLYYNGRPCGHAVVIYGYEIDGNGDYVFHIYDSSRFVDSLTCNSSGRYTRGSNAFSFHTTDSRVGLVWPNGYYTQESLRATHQRLKDANHSGAANLLEVGDQRYVYIFCSVGDVTLQNSSGNTATIRESVLSGDDMNLDLILPTFSMDDEDSADTRYYTIVAPEDAYTITTSDGNVTLVGVDMSVDVVATVSSGDGGIELRVSSDLCTVGLDTENEDNYYVNYYVYNDQFDTLAISGMAGESVNVSLKPDERRVDVTGARNITAEAVVGDKSSRVQDGSDFDGETVPFCLSWSAPQEGDDDSQSSLQIAQNLTSDSMNFAALIDDDDFDSDKMPMTGPADTDGESTTLNTREQLAPPTFDFRRNSDNTWEVSIDVPDDVTVIYYTTDESDPGTTDPRAIDAELRQTYGGVPILVAPNTQIVAIATKFPSQESEVAKWKFSDAMYDLAVRYGDVNNDGFIDGNDLADIISHMINDTPLPSLQAANVNGDDWIDGNDLADIISYMLNDTPLGPR